MQSETGGLTPTAFRTLAGSAQIEIIIKKSRFIGYASPVQDEEAALSFLRSIKEEHPLATHHCHAYVLGTNGAANRFSDDGEPSGTAGKPILEVLVKQELTNVCVVVVRYFGGTLLGRGGLVRAYTNACVKAVEEAGIATEEPSVRLLAHIPYPLWDRVQFAMKSLPVQVGEAIYTEQVACDILVRLSDQEMVSTSLSDATEGRIELTVSERLYWQWPAD